MSGELIQGKIHIQQNSNEDLEYSLMLILQIKNMFMMTLMRLTHTST